MWWPALLGFPYGIGGFSMLYNLAGEPDDLWPFLLAVFAFVCLPMALLLYTLLTCDTRNKFLRLQQSLLARAMCSRAFMLQMGLVFAYIAGLLVYVIEYNPPPAPGSGGAWDAWFFQLLAVIVVALLPLFTYYGMVLRRSKPVSSVSSSAAEV